MGIAVSAVSQMQDAAERVRYEINAPTIDVTALRQNTEDLNETATLAANNLARAGRLVESFKQSSIDRHSELSREFNLKSLAEDTVYNLSHQLKNKNVVVTVNCAEHLFLDGRPSLIEQLITNLVSNSLAHGYKEKGGLINIDLIFDHEKQTISILYKDDGRGIDKAIIDNIFEPFFTGTRTGGSGLGLYICHSIVTQDLSGTITCHSIENRGVSFLIKFPLEVELTPDLELNSVED
mgnify:FL=1